MSEQDVLYEVDNGVATVTINRPAKYNALNTAVVGTLREMMKQAEEDDSVRVVILTGTGEKAFAAGADIAEFKDKDSKTVRPLAENGQEFCKYMESMSKPVIARTYHGERRSLFRIGPQGSEPSDPVALWIVLMNKVAIGFEFAETRFAKTIVLYQIEYGKGPVTPAALWFDPVNQLLHILFPDH